MAKNNASNSTEESTGKRSIGDFISSGSQWISAAALVEQRRVFDLIGASIVDGKFGETIEFEIRLHGEFETPEEALKKVSLSVNSVRLQLVEELSGGEFPDVMMKSVLTSRGQTAYTFVDYTEEEQTKDTPF